MTPQSSAHFNLSSSHPSNSFEPFASQLVWTHTLKDNSDPFELVRPPAFQYHTIVCGGTCSCHQTNSFDHEIFHHHFHETYGSTSTVREVGSVGRLASLHVSWEPGRDHFCFHLSSCYHHLVHWFRGWHCGRPPDCIQIHGISFGFFWPNRGVCRLRDTPFFPTSPLNVWGNKFHSVTWTLISAEPSLLRYSWHPYACNLLKINTNYTSGTLTLVVSRVSCNAPSPEVDGRLLDALVVTAEKSMIIAMGIGWGRNDGHTGVWSCPCCRPLPFWIPVHCWDVNFPSCNFGGLPPQLEVARGHPFGTYQICNVICPHVFVSRLTLSPCRDYFPVAVGKFQSWICYNTNHCLESFQFCDCDMSDIFYHTVQGSHFAFALHNGDFLFIGICSDGRSRTMHIHAVWFKWSKSDIQHIYLRVQSKPQMSLTKVFRGQSEVLSSFDFWTLIDILWLQVIFLTGVGWHESCPHQPKPRWIAAARRVHGRRIRSRHCVRKFRRFVTCVSTASRQSVNLPPACDIAFRNDDFSPFQGIRVGEADNPGPDSPELDIATINPTQLLHKEDDIIQMGPGIYTIAESSVTQAALQVIKPKIQKAGLFAKWSAPVEPIHAKTSVLRGRAAGVAILSLYPIRPLHEPIPDNIESTCRFVDGIVQLEANCSLYISSLYGVADTVANTNARGITNEIFNVAAERALSYQGPAIISGDINTELENLLAWPSLQRYGWEDCALVDSRLHNRPPQPTCNERTRRSFVLANRQMASHLASCRTCPDYLFAAHPMLLAKFRLQAVIRPYLSWVLPQSTDNILFDQVLSETAASQFCQLHEERFQQAISAQQPEVVARIFSEVVESTWKASAVDVDGNRCQLKPGCLGRGNLKPLRPVCPSTPVMRKARDGDFEPMMGQATVELRRHTRQLRRLESLHSQLRSLQRKHSCQCALKCAQLWEAILHAKGFSQCFAWWMFQHFEWFVPTELPGVAFVGALKDVFRTWHTKHMQLYCLHKKRDRRRSIALDIQHGGSKAFMDVKDAPVAPLTHVVKECNIALCRTRWKKNGVVVLKLKDPVAIPLGAGYQYTFQGQTLMIREVRQNLIFLDEPVKLHNSHFFINQRYITADHQEMLDITAEAWNKHWIRDHANHHDDDWGDMEVLLEKLSPVADMVAVPIDLHIWKDSLRNLNKKINSGGLRFFSY